MKRVLVVDDDVHIRRLARVILADAGFEVKLASDGREALQVISEARPAVIVMDLNMPVMDGRELFERLQSTGKRPSILVISAGQAERTKKEMGAEASLDKPFSPEALIEKVTDLSGGKVAA